MTIIEASQFFKRVLKETDNKREIKVYNSFIDILSNLKTRDLTEEQFLLINNEIKTLNLKSNPENKRRFFNKKLTIFKRFLKDNFSLITEGYYTTLGISLGMSFGVAIGASFGESTGIAIGISMGMLIGSAIGRNKDLEAEKNNRVLKNKRSSL
ncbi:MAG: hypothetical protein ACI9SJ_000042 [Flavobacteriaceae bacterium]|jgi:hypothetical protein|uniref:hypothetical protein n=1 Tax=Candidatus Marifrigoribacter sp. Uisw_064 TaxID=3230970 RepID=UPI003ADDD02E